MFTPPLRELNESTSAGFACIEFSEQVLGIVLFPWQRWLLIHALELNEDGTFRFRTVVVLVARQNGKSTLAQVLALFFLYVRAAGLVIGTAQNLDIAEEVWAGAVEIAEDIPELADEIKHVVRVNGKKALELASGQRYKVQTANRRGGRGLSGDLVILDELREHQNWDAWGAITKTTLARQFAQIWALSNAGDASSVVLRHLRKVAHDEIGDPDGINREIGDITPTVDDVPLEVEDVDDSLGIFEWSAVPGCAIDDRGGWAAANPSLGFTLTERALTSAMRTDPEWVFRTECLCQWSDGTLEGPFPPGSWDAGVDALSEIPVSEPVSFGVDVSADRGHAHVAAAGRRADGDMHVEIVASRVGTEWVRDWFAERASADSPMRVVLQSRGATVSGLADDLRRVDGVEVVEWQGASLGIASGRMWDMVSAHVLEGQSPVKVWHRPQPILDVAAAVAVTKPIGDGAWLWDRVKSPADIAPLVAATAALWDATRVEDAPAVSAYESHGLVVLD